MVASMKNWEGQLSKQALQLRLMTDELCVESHHGRLLVFNGLLPLLHQRLFSICQSIEGNTSPWHRHSTYGQLSMEEGLPGDAGLCMDITWRSSTFCPCQLCSGAIDWRMGKAESLSLWYEVYWDFLGLVPFSVEFIAASRPVCWEISCRIKGLDRLLQS